MLVELSREAESVLQWRFEWLKAAGYNKRNAIILARDTSVDLWTAVEARKKCDNEKLLMRIFT